MKHLLKLMDLSGQEILGGGLKEINCKVHILTLVSTLCIYRSGFLRAAAKSNRIEFIYYLIEGSAVSDINTGLKYNAFFFHKFSSSLNDALVELHVRYAVHQKSADLVFALENRNLMASVV